jgi:hypothetical protein
MGSTSSTASRAEPLFKRVEPVQRGGELSLPTAHAAVKSAATGELAFDV